MPHTSNVPVAGQSAPKPASGLGKRKPTVQKETLAYDDKYAGNLSTVEQVLDSGLLPVGDVAAVLGIDVKRLRGFMFRNTIADPIGDYHSVYGWSCASLVKRLADIKAGRP